MSRHLSLEEYQSRPRCPSCDGVAWKKESRTLKTGEIRNTWECSKCQYSWTPGGSIVTLGMLIAGLKNLKKHELKRVTKMANLELSARYGERRGLKRGTLPKGFTDDELSRFFEHVGNRKAKLAFALQAYAGLRIGEVATLKRENIDLNKRHINFQSEKSGKFDTAIMPQVLANQVRAWMLEHEKRITESGGYLLFSDNPKQCREHLSSHWLRKEFRAACIAASIDVTYGAREGGKQGQLHRLSTHSLRHYFGTKFYDATKDLKLTQKALRHCDPKSTSVYIYNSIEQLEAGVELTFKGMEGHNGTTPPLEHC